MMMMKKKLTPHGHFNQALLQLHINCQAHEMSHFDPEQSGLADTTPLLPQHQKERAWNTTTSLFPDASATDLEAYYDPKSKRLMLKMAGAGKKAYPLFTEERLTQHLRINPKLSLEIKMALGQSAEDKLVQQWQEIREAEQRVKKAQRLKKNIKGNSCKTTTSGSRKRSKRNPS